MWLHMWQAQINALPEDGLTAPKHVGAILTF